MAGEDSSSARGQGKPRGAPLWKVTDFSPGLSKEERAGLEAALKASGILDAWVTPDGNLIAGDVTLVSGLAPVAGPSCAELLVPSIDPEDQSAAVVPEHASRAGVP